MCFTPTDTASIVLSTIHVSSAANMSYCISFDLLTAINIVCKCSTSMILVTHDAVSISSIFLQAKS